MTYRNLSELVCRLNEANVDNNQVAITWLRIKRPETSL